MPQDKRPNQCVYEDCQRPTWKNGGKKERRCLFHSVQFEAKATEFIAEVEAFKSGTPGELFLIGQPTDDSFISLDGFCFPEGISFAEHVFENNIDFSGAHFRKDASFDNAMIHGDIEFQVKRVGGNVNFSGATINGDLIFSDATVAGNSYFSRARLLGKMIMDDTTVAGAIHLGGATLEGGIRLHRTSISGDVNFGRSKISVCADFEDVICEGSLRFRKAEIKGNAIFSFASIGRDVTFSKVVVDGQVDFTRTSIKGVMDFGDSNISGKMFFRYGKTKHECYFNNIAVDGNVNFQGSTLGNTVFFGGAKIKGTLVFKSLNVAGGADFGGSVIEDDVDFENSIISGGVRFDYADIEGDVKFIGTKIKGNARFFGANIEGDADFSQSFERALDVRNASINGKFTLTGATIKRLIANDLTYGGVFSLIDVKFGGKSRSEKTCFVNVLLERANIVNTDLSHISFQNSFIREVNFDRVTFNEAKGDKKWWLNTLITGRTSESIHEEMVARLEVLEFVECENLRLGCIVGSSGRRNEKFAAAETSYRALKHVMEAQHARGLARKMRAGEMECKYQCHKGGIEKFILSMYRFFNGFGLKWIRALVFFLVTFLAFAFAYSGQKASYTVVQETANGPVERLATKRMDFGEAIWHGIETTAIIKAHTLTITDYNIRWVEGLQRIVSPVLLLLLGQAVRNVTRD